MVWRGISMEGRTDLYRLDNGTLTAIRYRDKILGAIVRPYAGAVGPGFFLVHDNAQPHVAREHAGSSWRMKELIPLNAPYARLTLNPIEHLWDIMFRSIRYRKVAPQTVQEISDSLVQTWEEMLLGTGMKSSEPLSDRLLVQWVLGSSRCMTMTGLMWAGLFRQFLDDESIDALNWPSCSSDLNPNEQFWDIMYQHSKLAISTTDCPGAYWCLDPGLARDPEDTICNIIKSMQWHC